MENEDFIYLGRRDRREHIAKTKNCIGRGFANWVKRCALKRSTSTVLRSRVLFDLRLFHLRSSIFVLRRLPRLGKFNSKLSRLPTRREFVWVRRTVTDGVCCCVRLSGLPAFGAFLKARATCAFNTSRVPTRRALEASSRRAVPGASCTPHARVSARPARPARTRAWSRVSESEETHDVFARETPHRVSSRLSTKKPNTPMLNDLSRFKEARAARWSARARRVWCAMDHPDGTLGLTFTFMDARVTVLNTMSPKKATVLVLLLSSAAFAMGTAIGLGAFCFFFQTAPEVQTRVMHAALVGMALTYVGVLTIITHLVFHASPGGDDGNAEALAKPGGFGFDAGAGAGAQDARRRGNDGNRTRRRSPHDAAT